MSDTRRSVLTAFGSAILLSGCIGSEDTEPQRNEPSEANEPDISWNQSAPDPPWNRTPENDFNSTTDPDSFDISDDEIGSDENTGSNVEPTVLGSYSSQPRLVDLDQTVRSGLDEYTATVQNTGIGGDITVVLVWLRDLDGPFDYDNVVVDGRANSEKEAERIAYFNEGERREVSFRASIPLGFEGYGFDLSAATYAADVKNDGGPGRIEIRLRDTGELNAIIDTKEIMFDKGETKRIEFNNDYHFFGDGYEIEAQIPNQ